MAVTPRTPGELATLAKTGLRYRRARRNIKASLHAGDLRLADLIGVGSRGVGDPVIGRMRVGQVLDAVPHMGPVKVTDLLEDMALDANTHLDQLTRDERDIILMRVG